MSPSRSLFAWCGLTIRRECCTLWIRKGKHERDTVFKTGDSLLSIFEAYQPIPGINYEYLEFIDQQNDR